MTNIENRPIRKLDSEVIGQIAAGEVVERPASAVKELVENSIDAGATAVTVELKDGGVSYLRVSDNGKGIPANQLRMAFERHATSKLQKSEDLFDIRTLGFRGEALASIGAVAKVTCTSRSKDADFGAKIEVEAGAAGMPEAAASPVGTTIVVRELFFNTPVRLKFLKKPTAEAALVSDYMLRLILCRPDVAFRFVSQGKTVYRSLGDGKLESALYCVYGKEAMQTMRKVHGVQNGVVVDGYVGVGELSRGNRQQQSFFVNGRYFRDEGLSKALENACQGWVMVGKFPCCALTLDMPYRLVDVNVHPNKLEVRFQNPQDVEAAIESAVRTALSEVSIREKLLNQPTEATLPAETIEVVSAAAPQEASKTAVAEERAQASAPIRVETPAAVAPATDVSAPEVKVVPTLREDVKIAYEIPREQAPQASAPVRQPVSEAPQAIASVQQPLTETPQTSAPVRQPATETLAAPVIAPPAVETQETILPSATGRELRYVGVAFKTYLMFECGERLLLVDQHAAHERILYDRLMKRYEGGHISQRLLSPQLVHLTARDCALLLEMDEALRQAGFEIEAFDETSVAVHAVPVILGENEPVRDILLEALDDWQSQRTQPTRERLRRHVMQMACKHAVKAGDTLSTDDVQALLQTMLQSGVQPTCPHGRPIVVEWTKRELEKRFKRIR